MQTGFAASKQLQHQKAISIPAVRLPKACTPLEPLAGPDGGPIDLYLHALYHEKLHAPLGVGHQPAPLGRVPPPS